MIRPSLLQTAAIIVFVADGLLALAIWRLGSTGPIPMHFSITGAVDRYGSRGELALVTTGLAVVGVFCWVMLELMRHRAAQPKGLAWAQVIMLLTFTLIGILFGDLAFGRITNMPSGAAGFGMVGLSLLMLLVGAFLGKAAPNPFVGVRTFWSLNSRLSWEKSNRLAGRLLFWIGAAGLLGSLFAPQPFGMTALICAVVVSAGASVIESWRVWRLDPQRNAF